MKEIKIPLFTVLFIFLGFFLYTKLFGAIPFSINSIQTTKTNLFTTQGTGKATEVPDTAFISMGITKSASNVIDAQKQTNEVTNTIINDLKNLGIEDKNIKTTNYSVNPEYRYDLGKQNITGYTVTQNLEVKIKPIDKANQIVDKVTSDGANLVGGISFVLDDNVYKKLENKAREEAVKNAKEKAQSLANAAGIKLGRIIDVSENFSPPIAFRSQAAGLVLEKANDQTTLTPGENTVNVTVTLSYETL